MVFRLSPYYKNYNKRITKSPKIYFYDTGVVCSLLGIKSKEELLTHSIYGHLFENAVIIEYIKKILNRGSREKFYFWRDSNGNEVDLLSVLGDKIKAYEIKSNKTARKKFSDNLVSFRNVANINPQDTAVIYGGSEKYIFNNTDYLPVASHKVC
ncbi:MAG: DUF4143 domain-containing protein [Candidatus Ancillula sp.]|nr:DUF4143 domain-containing protein [Candidatus Ancillula sp.]